MKKKTEKQIISEYMSKVAKKGYQERWGNKTIEEKKKHAKMMLDKRYNKTPNSE